jgi:hypothetical protein
MVRKKVWIDFRIRPGADGIIMVFHKVVRRSSGLSFKKSEADGDTVDGRDELLLIRSRR